MNTAGYWAARDTVRPVTGRPYPSNYYVAWLALLADERGRQDVTPYSFISKDLVELSHFFSLATEIPPSLHGFSANFHRYNHSAMVMNRFAHWIITCYQRNFNPSFITALDSHLAKVIYIQGKSS